MVLALGLSLLTGCATNLKAVRDFADETKKISVAFDPLLASTVDQCEQREIQKKLYASDAPLIDFDSEKISARATSICKPIADENVVAKGISSALSDYASKLSAVAGDGVASSVDDDYDALAKKLGDFKDLPKEKVTAVSGVLKFLTRAVIERAQKQEIEAALNHEEAVGALADALVTYAERVYGGYIADRSRDIRAYKNALLKGDIKAPELLAKLQLVELRSQELQLAERAKVIPALRKSVAQMKQALKDLRANLDKLSDEQQRAEVEKLAKDVKSLYQQLAKAF